MEVKHWALFFVSIVSKEIYYIDPVGTLEEDLDEIANKFILFAATNKYLKNIQFVKKYINHQKQVDSYNCGVYVCYFFQLLINRNLNAFQNTISIDDYRKTIFKQISKNSTMTVCSVCRQTKRKSNSIFKKILPSNLIILKCKHAFHKECMQNESCVACCQLNENQF